MEDEQIIELYWKRDEGAIRETDQKYGSYCYAISNHILHNHEDSEECVNDTWMKAWNAMPPHRPDILRLFLAKITRNLSFDRYKAKQAAKRGGGEMEAVLEELDECVQGSYDVEEAISAKELQGCLNAFVCGLPLRDSDIFLRRYYFVETTAEIAKRYGMRESNVLTILSRTRKKLKVYLRKEGYVL